MTTLRVLGLTWLVALGAFAEEPKLALRGLDPVELVQGNEAEGAPQFTATRGAFRYQFANEQNRQQFLDAGERFAVQFGGACMKMGPLSGGGGADRFVVHEGRIYLFASDSCRDSFLVNPEKFVDRPDEPASGTPGYAVEAKALLAKAVDAIGGGAALDALTSVETHYELTQKSGGRTHQYQRVALLALPDTYRVDEDYGDYKWHWIVTPAGADSSADEAPIEPSVCAFMRREMYREPLALLCAWRRGDVPAFTIGHINVDGAAARQVVIGIAGATSTLSIDEATGRILQVAYRGRGGAAGIGQVVRTFSDFKAVDGLILPHAVATAIDGQPLTSLTTRIKSIRVNGPLDPKRLALE